MDDKLREKLFAQGRLAREAARKLGLMPAEAKNKALLAMAAAVEEQERDILAANQIDMENARGKGMSGALLDRLLLNSQRVKGMANALREVAILPDPVGEVVRMWTRPNGLQIGQIRVPLGVVGMIYEARPNVTVDAAALCLKTGNAVILRGGSEALQSNLAIIKALGQAVAGSKLPEGSFQLIETAEREAITIMFEMRDFLDVLIPRGGAGLIQAVVNNSRVPVIETGVGNCHIFIDESANPQMAEEIVVNAKTQRPGVCNAVETLLVHKREAEKILPGLGRRLVELGVEIRGCRLTQELLPEAKPATEEDWETEYLALVLAVKVVESLEEALNHISRYGTKHSEAIVTSDYQRARRFLQEVDAAAVYVNASTRFTDGGEYGLGAEIGISTQKLHARGPMGLETLTSIKYIVYGDGQIRR
ncbi:MAG: glutamate-5-semialdehyde dehydrogenase [Syntrophomonadaceae bacterium]|nr:glutamate-5-semialdehyde dehydrogenase [Syntrophomonadaceae bacterium]